MVEEVELPLLEEAYRLWYLLAMEEFARSCRWSRRSATRA